MRQQNVEMSRCTPTDRRLSYALKIEEEEEAKEQESNVLRVRLVEV